ncbi:MAG: hypothetical protein ONB12_10680 [candidate division KSB1 bacterium]|nr:hypothetical protein [candidate division KSB1 bacterium]
MLSILFNARKDSYSENLFVSFFILFYAMEKETDIIRHYCGDIRSRLAACRDRNVAMALKERLCQELEAHCVSSMIKNVLLKNVEKIMDEIFSQDGKNKLLEKR